VQQPAQPPGNIQLAAPINPVSVPGPPSQSTNLAPDISTYPSTGDPYFQLTGDVVPQEDVSGWYVYPAANGSVLFNNLIPPPMPVVNQGNLHAFGDAIFYNGDTLMPDTWYLNPSLTGEIFLNDASGTQLLHSIDGNLFYNNELLAKANDIQDIADWSLYPSIAQVELAGQNIIQAGDISGASAHITSITTTNLGFGGATGTTLSLSGAASVGSLNSGGIINASSHQIQNATAITIGPSAVGTLTSIDGTALTWNGNAITTGGGGAAQNWSSYPALVSVDLSGQSVQNGGILNASGIIIGSGSSGIVLANRLSSLAGATDPPMLITAYQGLSVTADAGNITTTAGAVSGSGNITTTAAGVITNNSTGSINNVGNNYEITADGGLNPLITPNINLLSKNGNGGQVNVTADPGSIVALGGKVTITANGGTVYVPQTPPAPPLAITVGGEVDILANTGSGGLYTATSAVKIGAAGINIYAGALPSISSLLGYLFQYGTLGVSICAGLPATGIQFPGTVYVYGVGVPGVAGGVRIESPQGIQMLSDTYIHNLYPLDGDGLVIQGRSLPTGYVTIKDVAALTMTGSGHIKTDFINSASGNGLFYEDTIRPFPSLIRPGFEAYTIKPPQAISAIPENLVISGNPFPALGYKNYVQIQNADSIAFDVSGSGSLTGVQTINGSAYPPALPPIGDVADWALFNAKQSVDVSGFDLNNVNNMTMLGNGLITAAGQLSIFSDLAGDLTLAANGGGNVNIGTGNAGDIFIQTVGAGHDLSLAGDTVNITANAAMNINTTAGNTTIEGTDIVMTAASDFSASATTGSAGINGQVDVSLYAATGNVNLVADSGEVIVQDSVLNMNTHKITNLVAGTANTDAVNFQQLTTVVTSKDSTEFFVSDNGNDITGNGSFFAPFLTIQKAITQAELISSAANVCVIQVASGHYNENLTFLKGYIIVNGALSSQTGNEVCELTGSVSIALVGANDLFNRQVTFQGFNFTTGPGQAITDTSTSSHTVTFQDCKAFVYQQFFVSTATCPDMRLYITNVEVSQTYLLSVSPVIVTNVGLAEFERLDVSCVGNVTAIVVGGTSVLNRLSLSTLDATNAATTLLPLLSITSSTTATHSLGNVAFAFQSAVAKTATNAMFIGSSINTAIIMLNCVFTLTGTASSTNNCVGYNGVGSPTIAGINNTSLNVNVTLPQTTSVQSGITQIQYTNIQPPGLATYSSTADQVIAVTGTPQALTYNTTQFNQGTTLAANSRVYVNAQGNYALSYSVELFHTGVGLTQTATTFLKKNGTTIANTGRQWSIPSGGFQNAVMAEFTVSLNAGDYVEVFFSGDTSLSANATAAAGALPAIPSVVFNIKQFR